MKKMEKLIPICANCLDPLVFGNQFISPIQIGDPPWSRTQLICRECRDSILGKWIIRK